MYKCPQCGKKNKDDARYCDECGATLKKEPVENFYDRDSGSVTMVDSDAPLAAPVDYSKRTVFDFRPDPSSRGSSSSGSSSKQTINVLALVLSLLSLFMCFGCLSPVGLILSIVAFTSAGKSNERVSGLTVAALILSIIGTLELLMVLLAGLLGSR